VLVKISDSHGIYRGRGVSTDVIEASMHSLLAAVNRMVEVAERVRADGSAEASEGSQAKISAQTYARLSDEALSRDMKVSGTVKEGVHGA